MRTVLIFSTVGIALDNVMYKNSFPIEVCLKGFFVSYWVVLAPLGLISWLQMLRNHGAAFCRIDEVWWWCMGQNNFQWWDSLWFASFYERAIFVFHRNPSAWRHDCHSGFPPLYGTWRSSILVSSTICVLAEYSSTEVCDNVQSLFRTSVSNLDHQETTYALCTAPCQTLLARQPLVIEHNFRVYAWRRS